MGANAGKAAWLVFFPLWTFAQQSTKGNMFEVFGNPLWLCMCHQFKGSLYSITTVGEVPNAKRNFFFPNSSIALPYHPGVLTSKATYIWVNENNSQLSRAISIKLWNLLVSPCLLEVAISVSHQLGLICTWAHWIWLSVMALTQEGGPQQQVQLNFRWHSWSLTVDHSEIHPCIVVPNDLCLKLGLGYRHE